MAAIAVHVVTEPDHTDQACRDLRTEMLALDVDRVDLVPDGEVPPGAKADTASVATIVVALAGSPVLVQLGRLLRDWVTRATIERSSYVTGTVRWRSSGRRPRRAAL